MAGGLDPSAGAGLAADLAAAAAFGVIGLPVATSLTAQSSLGAIASYPVEPAIIAEQLEGLYADFRPSVIKIGLAGSAAIGNTLADFAQANKITVVVDPVLRASSGLELADQATQAVIRDRLAPAAWLLTPNSTEAASLTGLPVETTGDAVQAARRLFEAGAANVLVTGGHLPTGHEVIDTLYNENGVTTFKAPRLTGNVRGTGCSLAAAAAARLALGDDIEQAISAAREYVAGMISGAVQAGGGAKQHLGRRAQR
jgi:hydroxymethylpyrimidine kinase/phosphomethylpyrimidine kinase